MAGIQREDLSRRGAGQRLEVEALRRRIADLESEVRAVRAGRSPSRQRGRKPRDKLEADIEFIGDFDIVQARGIDISAGGICFEVAEFLPFRMRFEVDGTERNYCARLVWIKQVEEGGCRLGFQFEPGDSPCDF